MKLIDGIDHIAYLAITYYVIYQNQISIDNICYKSIDLSFHNIKQLDIHQYMKYVIYNNMTNRYPFTDEVDSIDILDFPNDVRIHLNGIDFIKDETIEQIIQMFTAYLTDNFQDIHHNDEIISINICPFDGFILTHQYIIGFMNLYFH